jgi:hypothetical protein
MTQLGPTTFNYSTGQYNWLYSNEGTCAPKSATLDITTFVQATHFPSYFLPAGLELGKITATGKFGPYAPAAVDGRQVFAGYLFSNLPIRDFLFGGASLDLIGAYLDGTGNPTIITSKLPIATQLSLAVQATRPLGFIYQAN